jgi:hypothetical protein
VAGTDAEDVPASAFDVDVEAPRPQIRAADAERIGELELAATRCPTGSHHGR